jgi:hypothetical protein
MEPLEAVFTVLGIVAVFLIGYFFARNALVRRKIVCPLKNEAVEVQFLCRRSPPDLIPFRVKSCTAFTRPRRITCGRECMKASA